MTYKQMLGYGDNKCASHHALGILQNISLDTACLLPIVSVYTIYGRCIIGKYVVLEPLYS